MDQPTSHRLLGVMTIVVVGLLAELLPSGPAPTHIVLSDQYVFIPIVWDILGTLAIFAIGGFVSRSRFVPVAAMVAVALWMVAQYILYQIALPAGQADTVSTAIENLPSLVIVTATSAVGAFLGEQAYSRRIGATPTTVKGQ